MVPDTPRARPRQETGSHQDGHGGGTLGTTVSHGADIRRPRRWTGCPCGCESVPPHYLDPACGRNIGIREAAPDWGAYDVTTLGLAPHDRSLCAACLAVGA